MLANISRRHKHGDEVLIITNGEFTSQMKEELSYRLGNFSKPPQILKMLADDILVWLNNRNIDDCAGFTYEQRKNLMYITMKKSGQPLQVVDISSGYWHRTD